MIPVTVTAPLQALAESWTSHSVERAKEFARRFAHSFGCRPEGLESGTSWLKFRIDLSELRLRGLNDLAPCLLVGGADTAAVPIVNSFWQTEGSRGGLPILFCASPSLFQLCQEKIPTGRRLILSQEMVRTVLEGESPRASLASLMRQQISRLLLSPFDFTHPTEGNMFFGRQSELRKLLEDEGTSYVIAGPGRIGKSSLLKQYKRTLALRRDPRLSRLHLIDFYDCPGVDAYSVAQHIAAGIGPRPETYEKTADRIVKVLRDLRHSYGGPVELLFDEVDEVCSSKTFQYLAQSVKAGDVRLIMCGRSPELLKFELGTDSNASFRLQKLRPTPLDEPAARELIRRPLTDLGIKIRDESELVDRVCRQTGRMPHLLQFYGKRLVEQASESGREEVDVALLEEIESNIETLGLFVSPIHELKDESVKSIAVALLNDSRTVFTPQDVTGLAAKLGQDRTADDVFDVCNLLVMQNVLAWRNDRFHVACEGIRYFSRKAGLL